MKIRLEIDEGQLGRKSVLKSSGQEKPSKHPRTDIYNYTTTPVTSAVSNVPLAEKTFPAVPGSPQWRVGSQLGVARVVSNLADQFSCSSGTPGLHVEIWGGAGQKGTKYEVPHARDAERECEIG